MKTTDRSVKIILQKSYTEIMVTLVLENLYKIVVPLFGAAYIIMIKFSIYSATVLQKIVGFKDFSRLLSDFPVLFKADLIFKDFSIVVGFVALRPKSTAMVIAGRSVHLTTLFPGQA